MGAAARRGDRDLGARPAPCLMQPRDEIARREGRIRREARRIDEARRVSGAVVEAGDNSGERPGKIRRVVGKDGQIEGRKSRRVAVGADRQRRALRTKPVDRISEHRPAGERDEPLVGTAHPPPAPPVEDEAKRQVTVGHAVAAGPHLSKTVKARGTELAFRFGIGSPRSSE